MSRKRTRYAVQEDGIAIKSVLKRYELPTDQQVIGICCSGNTSLVAVESHYIQVHTLPLSGNVNGNRVPFQGEHMTFASVVWYNSPRYFIAYPRSLAVTDPSIRVFDAVEAEFIDIAMPGNPTIGHTIQDAFVDEGAERVVLVQRSTQDKNLHLMCWTRTLDLASPWQTPLGQWMDREISLSPHSKQVKVTGRFLQTKLFGPCFMLVAVESISSDQVQLQQYLLSSTSDWKEVYHTTKIATVQSNERTTVPLSISPSCRWAAVVSTTHLYCIRLDLFHSTNEKPIVHISTWTCPIADVVWHQETMAILLTNGQVHFLDVPDHLTSGGSLISSNACPLHFNVEMTSPWQKLIWLPLTQTLYGFNATTVVSLDLVILDDPPTSPVEQWVIPISIEEPTSLHRQRKRRSRGVEVELAAALQNMLHKPLTLLSIARLSITSDTTAMDIVFTIVAIVQQHIFTQVFDATASEAVHVAMTKRILSMLVSLDSRAMTEMAIRIVRAKGFTSRLERRAYYVNDIDTLIQDQRPNHQWERSKELFLDLMIEPMLELVSAAQQEKEQWCHPLSVLCDDMKRYQYTRMVTNARAIIEKFGPKSNSQNLASLMASYWIINSLFEMEMMVNFDLDKLQLCLSSGNRLGREMISTCLVPWRRPLFILSTKEPAETARRAGSIVDTAVMLAFQSGLVNRLLDLCTALKQDKSIGNSLMDRIFGELVKSLHRCQNAPSTGYYMEDWRHMALVVVEESISEIMTELQHTLLPSSSTLTPSENFVAYLFALEANNGVEDGEHLRNRVVKGARGALTHLQHVLRVLHGGNTNLVMMELFQEALLVDILWDRSTSDAPCVDDYMTLIDSNKSTRASICGFKLGSAPNSIMSHWRMRVLRAIRMICLAVWCVDVLERTSRCLAQLASSDRDISLGSKAAACAMQLNVLLLFYPDRIEEVSVLQLSLLEAAVNLQAHADAANTLIVAFPKETMHIHVRQLKRYHALCASLSGQAYETVSSSLLQYQDWKGRVVSFAELEASIHSLQRIVQHHLIAHVPSLSLVLPQQCIRQTEGIGLLLDVCSSFDFQVVAWALMGKRFTRITTNAPGTIHADTKIHSTTTPHDTTKDVKPLRVNVDRPNRDSIMSKDKGNHPHNDLTSRRQSFDSAQVASSLVKTPDGSTHAPVDDLNCRRQSFDCATDTLPAKKLDRVKSTQAMSRPNAPMSNGKSSENVLKLLQLRKQQEQAQSSIQSTKVARMITITNSSAARNSHKEQDDAVPTDSTRPHRPIVERTKPLRTNVNLEEAEITLLTIQGQSTVPLRAKNFGSSTVNIIMDKPIEKDTSVQCCEMKSSSIQTEPILSPVDKQPSLASPKSIALMSQAVQCEIPSTRSSIQSGINDSPIKAKEIEECQKISSPPKESITREESVITRQRAVYHDHFGTVDPPSLPRRRSFLSLKSDMERMKSKLDELETRAQDIDQEFQQTHLNLEHWEHDSILHEISDVTPPTRLNSQAQETMKDAKRLLDQLEGLTLNK